MITGMDRCTRGDRLVTHLYDGTFTNPGLPMCKRGWNRGADGYSIFRNNISRRGVCKVCERRAREGRKGVPCPE